MNKGRPPDVTRGSARKGLRRSLLPLWPCIYTGRQQRARRQEGYVRQVNPEQRRKVRNESLASIAT